MVLKDFFRTAIIVLLKYFEKLNTCGISQQQEMPPYLSVNVNVNVNLVSVTFHVFRFHFHSN